MKSAVDLYDVATIGNYTKDTIVSATGTRYVDGGGVNYAAHAAAALGLRVAAITRLASEDKHVVEALERAGIDVFFVETPSSTLMRLEYPTENVDERVLTVKATAGSFTREQVEPIDAKAYVVSPSIRGEVTLDVIRELKKKKAMVAADAQGFVRVLAPDGSLENREWPQKPAVLAELDVLKADAVEAAFLTGESDIHRAAKRLVDLGSREIVLTHRNGILVYADGEFFEATFCPKQLVGRSGRGDTCLGSYVGKRLTAPPQEAMLWAAAVTSLKMEAEGPIQRELHEVRELVQEISRQNA